MSHTLCRMFSSWAATALLAAAGALPFPARAQSTEEQKARFPVWTQSSLARIYPKSPVGSATSSSLTAARNQRISFQIGVRNTGFAPLAADCTVAGAADLKVRVRRVGYVPMAHLTPNTSPDHLEGEEYLPGLVPEPLFEDTAATVGPLENQAYWVSIEVPEQVEPGSRTLSFQVRTGPDHITTVSATVDVRPFTIRKRRDFPVTHWWRPDVIWTHYKVRPWSEECFALIEKYMRNMIDHGSNVMFIPALENRRETFRQPMQALIITRDGDRWNFDFSRVRRLVEIGKRNGAEYFEWPHLWLYWGVKFASPVYFEKPDGTWERAWSAEADGYSPEYLNFLRQYLQALHAFLQEEQILDRSFFHLSDEPDGGGPEAIERYEKARGILKEYAPWMKVMDALGDFEYAKKGVTDIPVPLVAAANAFIEHKIPHWVYYCCMPTGNFVNRFFDTPLTKIRMSGWLFYRLGARGFLHWGYNYWHKLEQDHLLDVFAQGDSGMWPMIPYGDAFVVYPGPDGPLDSIRWEVFAESLQDYVMLQTAGISPDDPLLAPIRDYMRFPKDEEWIRKAILDVLDRKAGASPRQRQDGQEFRSFFPLMAWDDVDSEETIAKMAGCGINSIAFVPAHLLDACQRHGIRAILYDERVTPDWDKPFDSKAANEILPELIRKYNDHPALYGYHLKDEPDEGQFPELGKSAKLVSELAPGKWPYINLPPGMGDWYADTYLQKFVDTCAPPVISYDNYAIGETGTFSYGYWANMWDVRRAALRNNLPFHTILLTAAHFNYRVPSDADLRLQVYGALAYGARGIGYYKIRSRPLAALRAPDLGNFRQAPLDEFDEKTAMWPVLRNLNRQLANIIPALLKLRSDDVYHIGEIPERNHGLTSSTLVSGLTAGTEFIIGDFTHEEDASRWVMIVNKNLKESAFCRPEFRGEVKAVKYLSPITGKLEAFPAPWYALAPGQGVLLKLEQ